MFPRSCCFIHSKTTRGYLFSLSREKIGEGEMLFSLSRCCIRPREKNSCVLVQERTYLRDKICVLAFVLFHSFERETYLFSLPREKIFGRKAIVLSFLLVHSFKREEPFALVPERGNT